MDLVRRLVELGRAARADAAVRVRQPLARALVGAPGFAALPAELRAQVADELNVRALEALDTVGEDLVDYTVKPNFRALGRRFGKGTRAGGGGDQRRGRGRLAARPAHGRPGLGPGRRRPGQRSGADDVIMTQVAPRWLGGGRRRPARPSRWTSPSRRSCAGRAWPVR